MVSQLVGRFHAINLLRQQTHQDSIKDVFFFFFSSPRKRNFSPRKHNRNITKKQLAYNKLKGLFKRHLSLLFNRQRNNKFKMYGNVGLLRERRDLQRHRHKTSPSTTKSPASMKPMMNPPQLPMASSPAAQPPTSQPSSQ
jgi:hypothetical protein